MQASADPTNTTKETIQSRYATIIALKDKEVQASHVEEIRQLANQNKPAAINQLGYYYRRGLGGLKSNLVQAKKYYKAAAKQGNLTGMSNLVWLYHQQLAKKNNWQKIAYWVLKRARLIAKENLQNDEKSVDLLGYLIAQAKAKKPHPAVLTCLGIIYLEGLGVTKDIEKALKYFQHAENTLQSNKNLCGQDAELTDLGSVYYYIGPCYLQREYTEKNAQLAFEYLGKAAAKNHSSACLALATCYETGIGTAVSAEKAAAQYLKLAKNKDASLNLEAFQKLEELANQNALDPLVLNSLALCYREGYAVKRNLARAIQLCEDIVQLFQDQIEDGALHGESLLLTYEQISLYYAEAIYPMQIEVLEKQRADLRKQKNNDEQISQINFALQYMHGQIKDEEAHKRLAHFDFRANPELRKLIETELQIKAQLANFTRQLKDSFKNLRETLEQGKWQVWFLGAWYEGTPAHAERLIAKLKKTENMQATNEIFQEYCKIIKFLSNVSPTFKRHPSTTARYLECLDAMKQVTTVSSSKMVELEKRKNLLDLSDDDEKTLSPLIETGKKSQLYPTFNIQESSPPAYVYPPVPNIDPSAPDVTSTVSSSHFTLMPFVPKQGSVETREPVTMLVPAGM